MPVQPVPVVLSKKRIDSIDILRGIIMVIMVMDHVRDFFHITASTDSPTNLATTTPMLFFTRWITHFCAPCFVLLAGTSAYLYGLTRTKAQISSFLLKRGCFLVAVEIIIMSLLLTFDPLYHVIVFQVIWAIGISMISLGLCVFLPAELILTIGLVIVLSHNLLDYPASAHTGGHGFLWDLLHSANFARYEIIPGHFLLIVYPFLPWIGVMFCGYAIGKIFAPAVDPAARKRYLMLIGIFCTAGFIILRFSNRYGDPHPWIRQQDPLYTFLSFLNLTKYPPSVMYLGMTLGPSLLLLAFLENLKGLLWRIFMVFGRVPFFFYVVHFFIVHLLCLILFFVKGYGSEDIQPHQSPFLFRPDHFGFSLPVVYLIWISIIMLMYPFCKMYGNYKRTHKQWWVSYF